MTCRGLVGLVLVLAVAGCGDDVVPSSSGSTTGEPASETGSSTTGDTTGTADDGSTSTGDPQETESSGTTTGGVPQPQARARFLAAQQNPETKREDLLYYEYDAGVLSEPVSLASTVETGSPLRVELDPGRRMVSFCSSFTALGHMVCSAADVSTAPPGPALSFELPLGFAAAAPRFVPELEGFVVLAHDEDQTAEALYWVPLEGAGLGTPEVLVPFTPSERIFSDFVVDATTGRVGFVRRDVDGLRRAVVASLDPSAGASQWLVSPDGDDVSWLGFVPHHDAVVYGVGGGSFTRDALHFVNLEGEAPGAPLRIDDPALAMAGNDIDGPYFAPDGHALAYWVGDWAKGGGDVAFVDLAEETPGMPTIVYGAPHDDVSSPQWSSDSRWLAFSVHDGADGTYALVDASGSAPGRPGTVSAGTGLDAGSFRFDEAGQWLYTWFDTGRGGSWWRTDVSGGAAADMQRVSEPGEGAGHWELIVSGDWSRVLYTGVEPRDFHAVEVSGATPSEVVPVPLFGVGDGGLSTFDSRLSHDGDVALIVFIVAEILPPFPLYLREIGTDVEIQVAFDVESVEPLPPARVAD